MSKYKQRKYLERYADGGVIKALKNRQKILDEAEMKAITPRPTPLQAPLPIQVPSSTEPPPTNPDPGTVGYPTMPRPVGPVNQEVTKQALKVKQEADRATKSLGLRGYANGGFMGSPGFGAEDYQGIEGGSAGRRDSSVPLSSSMVRPKPWAGRPQLGRIGSTRDLVGMSENQGAVKPMAFSAMSPNSPASGPATPTAAPPTMLGGKVAPASTPAPLPTTPSPSTPTNPNRATWAQGLDLHNAAAMPTVGQSMGTGFGNVPINPKTGYPMMKDGGSVPFTAWGGPTEDNESTRVHSPIYKGLGGKWDGMPMFANGGAVPRRGSLEAYMEKMARRGEPVTPAPNPDPPVMGPYRKRFPAPPKSNVFQNPDMLPPFSGTTALAEGANKGATMARMAGIHRASQALQKFGSIPGRPVLAPTTPAMFAAPAAGIVGGIQSLAQSPEFRDKFASSVGLDKGPWQRAGADAWRTMANVGNQATGGLAGVAGGWLANGIGRFADGGSIPEDVNAVRLARPSKVKGDATTALLAEGGAKGSEYLVKKGLPRLAQIATSGGQKVIPGMVRFVPPAAGVMGAVRSLAQGPEERAHFAQSVGLGDTPLGSTGADAWRAMANVGNAVTGGLADVAGQYGSDLYAKAQRGMPAGPMFQHAFADGGTVQEWNPSMGVNIPEGGYAVMTQRGTGRKIILDRGGYKGSRKGLKKYSAEEFKKKMGWADGGAVPHGRVTKDYFEDVDQQMGNGGGVEEGMIYGEGGPTDDEQPIMASPGEFIVPADVARKHKRKLRKMVAEGHTPVHKQGLRGGYAGGGGIPNDPLNWEYLNEESKAALRRGMDMAKQTRDSLTQRAQAAAPRVQQGLRGLSGRAQRAAQRAAQRITTTTTPIAEALNPKAPVWSKLSNKVGEVTRGLKDLLTRGKGTSMTAFQKAQAALQGPNKPFPDQPHTFERFPNAQGQMQELRNKKWASATPEPGAVEPPQRPISQRYAPRPTFEQALKDSPLPKPSPQRALDIEQLATRGTDVAGKMKDWTKVQKLRNLGSRIMSSKPAQMLGKVAAPLTLAETAREAFGTDTADYRKRFGLDSPEAAAPGLGWLAKPGLGSDLVVRGLGAASDLGNVMTLGQGQRLFRDVQAKEAAANEPPKPPEKPGLAFSKDPGPKDSSQRENQGIPIPARTGLRLGEELPPFDAQGRRIDATEIAPPEGGGYISGVSPVTGKQRLVKYTKDSMPLGSGVFDTSTPEQKAADAARREGWKKESAEIDARMAASGEAENRRIDEMVERNAMNSAAYNRREGLRSGNTEQYMGGLQDQELGEQRAQRRAISDAASQNRAGEMARAKMSADVQKYNTDAQVASNKYQTDATIRKAEIDDARARATALAGMREKHGTDFDNFLTKSAQTINPETGQLDLATTSEKQKEFMKWAYAPAVNNPEFLKQFGGAGSIDDLPKSQWAPLWEAFQTKRSMVKDIQPDQSDSPLEGLATDLGMRPIKAMDWYDPDSSRFRNNISLGQAMWGASGGWNPFVSNEDRWLAQTGTQGSKIQNTTLRDAQWNTPSKRLEAIAMLRRAGKNQEADELAKLAFGDRRRGLR